MSAEPFFELRDIRKEYVLRRSFLQRFGGRAQTIVAVDGVTLSVPQGSIFGLVGESGSGKSTLAQIMVRLLLPTSGQVFYRGQDVTSLDTEGRLSFRQGVQMVFQDTHSSLNPRKRIRRTLREALGARNIRGAAAITAMERLMQQVGLDRPLLDRLPHELSGGQRQRVGIARALALAPEILIADEPVSSLDVSLQGQIINLLRELNRSLGLTIVLISHDLAVVARVCSALAVMNKGRIVEMGPPSQVLVHPEHPYTRALLASVPRGLASRRTKEIVPQRVA